MSHVKVSSLAHRFGKEQVLKDVNFTIPKGSITGLLGPSGSGKTTLIRCIAGLIKPTEGNVEVLGTKYPDPGLARQIGYMAQFDALYEDLSAGQNLAFFAALYGLRGKAAKKRSQEVLELTGLGPHTSKQVKHFSGGMKKRLSLAITLLHQPVLLMLDEPTVGIDPVLRADFWMEFKRLKEAGCTLIVSTHVMDEAGACDTLGMIFEGNMLAWDSPAAIMKATNTTTVEQAFLSLRSIGGAR